MAQVVFTIEKSFEVDSRIIQLFHLKNNSGHGENKQL